MTNPKNEKLPDLTAREIATFVPLIIMALWIGLYPKPFFQILEQPTLQLSRSVQEGAKNPNEVAATPEAAPLSANPAAQPAAPKGTN